MTTSLACAIHCIYSVYQVKGVEMGKVETRNKLIRSVPVPVYNRLERIAKRQRISASEAVRRAIEEYTVAHGTKKA